MEGRWGRAGCEVRTFPTSAGRGWPSALGGSSGGWRDPHGLCEKQGASKEPSSRSSHGGVELLAQPPSPSTGLLVSGLLVSLPELHASC